MKQVRTRATTSNEVSERELKHRELARAVAAESIVLLENDGVLPLQACPIALFGAGAATTIKGGSGSGEVNERYSVTIEKGLQNAGFEVSSSAWLREYEQLLAASKQKAYQGLIWKALRPGRSAMNNIMADAFQYPVGRLITSSDIESSATDTCIYVIARLAGEGSDRSLDGEGYYLAEAELENLKVVAQGYKNTILVINVSGPLDLSPLDDIEGINAVLFFCQQGMEGGNALADILAGAVTPSGALTSSWARHYQDLPFANEHSSFDGETQPVEYKEGLYVGYRFFDSFAVAPRYEFGYGLSYTDFSIEFLGANLEGENVIVSANVSNCGTSYAGKRNLQLYVSAPNNKLRREYQSLAAFAKTKLLAPGESEEVTLSFSLSQIAAYDEETASYLLEQGSYTLRLGTSSQQTAVVAVLNLDKTVVTEQCVNVCPVKQDFQELEVDEAAVLPERIAQPNIIVSAIQQLSVDADSLRFIEHDYQLAAPKLSAKTAQVLAQLNTEDLQKIVVATGFMDNDPYFSVFGAAAYTTSDLVDQGVPNVALCDGPAGLRLSQTLVKQKNGSFKPTEPPLEMLKYAPWLVRRFLTGNPQKGELLYQYASAFPVGTALAQTWNTGLIEQVGDAVGTEMAEFGVTFWLAPGMNLQRSPLCGRNFEYYSEDPLLTGKMAAAISRGVQKHQGCYVTLKHYAANNQETNRNHANSIIRERTLRELYLKAFRIAVQEGGAKAVMTSYNLLNGVYTANSNDLCTKLLRCEWGFDGVVMTDWFSTGKGLADNGLAIKAGNDLICPGNKAVRTALKAALDQGLVSPEELRLSAARVLEAVINGQTDIPAKPAPATDLE